ncbi:TPA: hypothetical protein NDU38_005025 [Pseudomonas aeruginosa]|nr:hypothetical protein [Pseudomonas aeruginosa]
MQVGDFYSHKGGREFIEANFPNELREVLSAIQQVRAADVLTKRSEEKTKPPLLFSPEAMNEKIKRYLSPLGWTEPAPGSKKGFREPRIYLEGGREFREMDGIKNRVGLEIQFGKYAFMGYDIFSKMPIFARQGLIVCGIEVVAMPSLIPHMSTGVSSFSQIVMDMRARGEADIDVPTLVIGIDCSAQGWLNVQQKREAYAFDPAAMLASGAVSAGRNGARPGPK